MSKSPLRSMTGFARARRVLDTVTGEGEVIVITHRLSTVRRADRILVLDRGRIAETGSHEELVSRGGIYQHLYDLQFLEADVNP